MNDYTFSYTCTDGYTDEITVSAANKVMAYDLFYEMIDDMDIDIIDDETKIIDIN